MGRSIRKPKIDRISSLPDDVLHNILSYVCIFEGVKLCVLSKRWKYIWTTMPYLHFDLDHYYRERYEYIELPSVFEKFIYWALISQPETKLVRFLFCFGGNFDKSAVLRWVHAATRRSVQELVVRFIQREPFQLPYCVAACESLRVLKLHLCWDILKLPNCVGFHQLRLLHLEDIRISDQCLTNCLFSKSKFLEKLILKNFTLEAFTLLDIASTSLVHVSLHNRGWHDTECESFENCEVKITCPNLKFLRYKAPKPKDIVLKDLFSIEYVRFYLFEPDQSYEAGILVHNMIKEVQSTSVLKFCLPDGFEYDVASCRFSHSPVSLYKLKCLKLDGGFVDIFIRVMMLLLKYSPALEVLELGSTSDYDFDNEDWKLHDPDESIVCLESHLKSVHLTCFNDDENEIALIRFFLKNAHVLEKLTIVWDRFSRDKFEEAAEKILKFPRTSSHADVVFLDAKRPAWKLYDWYKRY